jgi:uncharacterized membrane protein
MLCIMIGAAALLGTAAFCRRRWRHHGCHGRWGHHERWGGHGHGYGWHEAHHDHEGFFGGHAQGPWGRGPWGRFGGSATDRWASMLAWRLEASPSQSEVIREAFRSVAEEVRAAADERKSTREDLGKAVGGEQFDEQVMGELFARHDQRLEQIRRAVVGALARVHDVLEPTQRERLASMLGRRGFGPYRM